MQWHGKLRDVHRLSTAAGCFNLVMILVSELILSCFQSNLQFLMQLYSNVNSRSLILDGRIN